MTIQDDGQSFKVPDLSFTYPSGGGAVVEVVIDMDREYGSTYASLLKHGGQIPAEIPLMSTDRIWWVGLRGGAHVKTLFKRIASIIEQLSDELGEEIPGQMTILTHLPPTAAVEKLLALGVQEVGSRPLAAPESPVAYLRTAAIFGPHESTWEELLAWIEEYLSGRDTADVRDKLGRSGAKERHAFVVASFTSPWAVYHGLAEGRSTLPPAPPVVPSEITHLWLWTVPPGGRCLAWFPDKGWFEPRNHWATD